MEVLIPMRHWYVVFPAGTLITQAQAVLNLLDSKMEVEQPEEMTEGGDLFLAVLGPNDLIERVKEFNGIKVYDNETRPELW